MHHNTMLVLKICSNYFKFGATLFNLQQLYFVCSNVFLICSNFVICCTFLICPLWAIVISRRTNLSTNKLNTHLTPSMGIRPGPHWWEATMPNLLPPLSFRNSNWYFSFFVSSIYKASKFFVSFFRLEVIEWCWKGLVRVLSCHRGTFCVLMNSITY